jgi:pSer/pThr/pTyr-binding forkhead associated (FHA) protein
VNAKRRAVLYEDIAQKAELYSTLFSIELLTTTRKFNNFSRHAYNRLVERKYPWVCPKDLIGGYPQLKEGLEFLWTQLPSYCLFVPVFEVIPQTIVILGCEKEPNAERMAQLLSVVSKAIKAKARTYSSLKKQFKSWTDHPSPTMVVQKAHACPYLNVAAQRILRTERAQDLASIIGAENYQSFIENIRKIAGKKNFTLPFVYSHDGKVDRAMQIVVSEIDFGYSLVLTDLGIIEKKKPKVKTANHKTHPGQANRAQRPAPQTNTQRPAPQTNTQRPAPQTNTQRPARASILYLKSTHLPLIQIGHKLSMSIGRDPRNDIVLVDNKISRFHATLKVQGGHITVEDLGSSNGVTINGERRSQSSLTLEDSIKIGPYEFTVTSSSSRAITKSIKQKHAALDQTTTEEDNYPGFSGDLQCLSVYDIGSMIEEQKKSGCLGISSSDCKGEIVFDEGLLVFAKASGTTTKKALSKLLSLIEGRFRFEENFVVEKGHFGLNFSTLANKILGHEKQD